MTGPIHEQSCSHLASELKPTILTLCASGGDEQKALSEFADIYFSLRSES
jgi:hypothetical protein